MSSSFDLDPVERITAGATGVPGRRTFFLQARAGERLVTFLVEKQQVEALATTLQQMLEALPDARDEGTGVSPDELDLEEPLLAEWRIGPMGLEFDAEREVIVLTTQEALDDEGEDPASARFVLTRSQARALAERAVEVCAAGRPTCRLCSLPIDPEGHVCPATNGHRRIGS